MSSPLRLLPWTAALIVAFSSSSSVPPATGVEHQHECRYCSQSYFMANVASGSASANGRQYAPNRYVDVRHIKIDLTPDFETQTIAATATLKFAPISQAIRMVRLDAVDLKVGEVRGSRAVRDFSTGDTHLSIVFEEPIAAGEEVEVEIEYTAEPAEGFYFRTDAMGLPKGDTHCWVQGEPHEARHWFPAFDYPNERSSSEIVCHVPREMTVISNGRLIEEVDEGDGMKRVHWLQEKPHVSYLICLVAGYLEKLEGAHRDIPLGFYVQPSKAKYAANAFQDTAAIMAFYEEEIGVPYPWTKYDQVTCADYHWGGMENTTITTLNQRTIYSDATENVFHSRTLDAHELAHQWFGNYVTCKDWSHIWLNEGFATYYAHLYEGHKFGRDHLLHGLYLDARSKIFPNQADERPMVYRGYKAAREQFDFRNYPKGGWVLHMLRSQLGPERYRAAIRQYLEKHALGEVVTDDLRQVLEAESGLPLDRFFDQWVYHGGLPSLRVTYRWLAEEKLAHVTVEQMQTVSDKVLLFELPTEVRFVVDGETVDKAITIDGRRHDFYFPLAAEPRIVRFDPAYTVLARVEFPKTDKLLEAQLLENEGDVIGRLLACDALADRKTRASVAALQKALRNDPFFGVRIAAAEALRKIRTAEAVAVLVDAIGAEDARVRLAVVEELGRCHRDEAREALLTVIDEEQNPAVSGAAIRGLASSPGKVAATVAREALRSESWGNEPIAAAFTLIRGLNEPSLAKDLMTCIRENEQRLDPRDTSEGMFTLARISQGERQRTAAFKFLTKYLDHPRAMLRAGAIRALGELREPSARELLEAIASDAREGVLAGAAKSALAELDRETPLVPPEVGTLRREIRELRSAQEELQKSLDELKARVEGEKPAHDDSEEGGDPENGRAPRTERTIAAGEDA